MSIDKYKQAFQEEAREVLTELESTLLELNANPVDAELIGRAFRALHTIKGSGAMFKFDDISYFTHHKKTPTQYSALSYRAKPFASHSSLAY
ncbi:MAG TPA: Hpt domain-containing protein [Candidatus Acidoferrales bacterium]|nr:Hpt domain-containing protein [Candidatus Acidoferrales bacterium]